MPTWIFKLFKFHIYNLFVLIKDGRHEFLNFFKNFIYDFICFLPIVDVIF